MGLRLVAHYLDRYEAVIVAAALDAAGVPVFVENYHQVSAQPFSEIALGGFRLMVCEQDLGDALAVIGEARRKSSFEGERLSKQALLIPTLALFFLFGLLMPLRSYRWIEVR